MGFIIVGLEYQRGVFILGFDVSTSDLALAWLLIRLMDSHDLARTTGMVGRVKNQQPKVSRMLSLKLLKQYLQEKPEVSLLELQQLLQEDAETVSFLLRYFIDRGQVRQRTLTNRCGTHCQKCPAAVTQLFSWQAPAKDSAYLS